MSKDKKLTTTAGCPVAHNQNVMTAGRATWPATVAGCLGRGARLLLFAFISSH